MESKETHWDRFKKYYYVAGGFILTSTSLAVGYKLGKTTASSGNINGLINVNSDPIQNNYTIQLLRRGHPGNKILCNQTGEAFASQQRAAEANGISASSLSKHLRGIVDNVDGLTFEKLGEMV